MREASYEFLKSLLATPVQPLEVVFGGIYAQDEWQVNRNLRLTGGLRVEVTGRLEALVPLELGQRFSGRVVDLPVDGLVVVAAIRENGLDLEG
jgi:hypothetical protein